MDDQEAREQIADLERRLGVKGTANVFRKALALAREAADAARQAPPLTLVAAGRDEAKDDATLLDDLVAALKQCRDELGSIHHARADVDHAEKHSAGFRLANAALAKATTPD